MRARRRGERLAQAAAGQAAGRRRTGRRREGRGGRGRGGARRCEKPSSSRKRSGAAAGARAWSRRGVGGPAPTTTGDARQLAGEQHRLVAGHARHRAAARSPVLTTAPRGRGCRSRATGSQTASPRSRRWAASAATSGVLPVPPQCRLPTLTTGTRQARGARAVPARGAAGGAPP